MEPGIMLYMDCKTDIFEQIKILKEIGIRRTFVVARKPKVDDVIAKIKEEGMICDNFHSEFVITYEGKQYATEEMCKPGIIGDLVKEQIIKNIDTCKEHGVPVLVVHSSMLPPELANNEYTKKRYLEISDYAREKSIKIAFENINYTENLAYLMKLVPDAGFCWDCGHENCLLKGEKPMKLFGDRLLALHIHDNFLNVDNHYIPFTAKIDFEEVGKSLAESGYDGTLMLETLYRKGEGISPEATYRDFAIQAKCAAEKIIEIVNRYKNDKN